VPSLGMGPSSGINQILTIGPNRRKWDTVGIP
jgi:hypothetical protein